jgi:hypothetical protein
MHGRARIAAVQRARPTALVLTKDEVVIRSKDPATGAVDTVGVPLDMAARYGVTVETMRDSVVFDPRGQAWETSSTLIYLSRGSEADTIQISALGKLLR